MPDVITRLRTRTYAFALALSVVLLIANIVVEPRFGAPSSWPEDLASLAPLVLAAMASTPSIIAGGGGIDISVGPIMVVVNVIFVQWLLTHGVDSPWLDIPILLAIGGAIGLVNGVMVTQLRFQPVIATLCTLIILGGAAVEIAQAPRIAPHNWTGHLADQVWFVPGGLILIAIPVLLWLALSRTPFHRVLYAVGGNDVAAYSAGVDVQATRMAAYTLNGVIAAVGGIALTALVQSTQATSTTLYTLLALAAVALGGTPLGGGGGGLMCSAMGATALYLVQTLLSATGVPSRWLDLVYGLLLIAGVVVGARLTRGVRPRAA